MLEEVLISVVSPVYKGEKMVDELVRRVSAAVSQISEQFEIILVEDGSPDNSWAEIEKVCHTNPKVKGISLSRNFGQHYAIMAGLDNAKGEWIVVMDCDLQDVPEEIPKLYQKAVQENFDFVRGQRTNRNDTESKKISSRLFYLLLSYLIGKKLDPSAANFGIFHRKVVDAIRLTNDKHKVFVLMLHWVGFRGTNIPVAHHPRLQGKSSYSLKKLLDLALEIILTHSDKPLRLMIRAGFLVTLLAFGTGLYFLLMNLLNRITVSGFTSVIVSISFFSGLIIFFLGIIGLYIGKTFEGVKDRPIYIISKRLNKKND
jgi:glycosyltransferase involved in cell wall biosynthesis